MRCFVSRHRPAAAPGVHRDVVSNCIRSASRSQAPRRGFTLVEAVVGTVLIAAFASSVFLAFRVHNEQLREASDTMQAVAFADQQLDVLLGGQGKVRSEAGEVAGHPDWQWSIAPVRQEILADTRAEISRFRIVRSDGRVLVSTDVISNVTPPRSGGATR